jgi:hypothetical protein
MFHKEGKKKDFRKNKDFWISPWATYAMYYFTSADHAAFNFRLRRPGLSPILSCFNSNLIGVCFEKFLQLNQI